MAGNIPQQFIDDLLSRVDIVDVINRRVTLQKKGKEYQACCPFHGEKTPSFTVSPSKQFYHCFGWAPPTTPTASAITVKRGNAMTRPIQRGSTSTSIGSTPVALSASIS